MKNIYDENEFSLYHLAETVLKDLEKIIEGVNISVRKLYFEKEIHYDVMVNGISWMNLAKEKPDGTQEIYYLKFKPNDTIEEYMNEIKRLGCDITWGMKYNIENGYLGKEAKINM